MRIDPVTTDHPEVPAVQPTWHCLLRFRQRARPPAGTEAAIGALRESLAVADIARVPPPWLAGRESEAEMWAVDGRIAYPLTRQRGVWVATTCLTAART